MQNTTEVYLNMAGSNVSGYRNIGLAVVPANTATGRHVNEFQSLAISAVWSGIDLIASDIARMPLNLYEFDEDDGKSILQRDPRHFAVRHRANRRQSAQEFWKRFIIHSLLWNHAFARINPQPGLGVELQHCNPWEVAIYDVAASSFDEAMTNPVYYQISRGGYMQDFDSSRIVHVRGLTVDVCDDTHTMPWVGFAKQSLALGLAVQDHGASFFGNGTTSGGTLEFPLGFDQDAMDKLLNQFRRMQGGTYSPSGGNAWKVIPLREGVKFNENGTDPEKSQMNETREMVIRDVARWLRIPPHRLAAQVSTASHSSIEGENRAYLNSTLASRMADVTGELNLKLLRRPEHGPKGFAYDTKDFIKPTQKEQAETDALRLTNGEATVNEIRKERGMAPAEDDFADYRTVPANMMFVTDDGKLLTVHETGNEEPEESDPEETETDQVDNDEFMAAAKAVVRPALQAAVDATIRQVKSGKADDPEFPLKRAAAMSRNLSASVKPLAVCLGAEPEYVVAVMVNWFVGNQLPELIADIEASADDCKSHAVDAMLNVALSPQPAEY